MEEQDFTVYGAKGKKLFHVRTQVDAKGKLSLFVDRYNEEGTMYRKPLGYVLGHSAIIMQ